MNDLDLYVSAIVARDASAFGRWMAAAEGELRMSLRSFASVIDTEAVLQEALVRVWQVAPRFVSDGRPNGLLRFAVRISRNLAVSEVRRTKAAYVEPVADDDPVLACDPQEVDPLLRQTIATCVEALPPKPREVLHTRLGGGGELSDDDLAGRLNMRLNTFLQNFGRARKMLAECLSRHGIAGFEELTS